MERQKQTSISLTNKLTNMPKSPEDTHEFQFHECLLAVQKSQLTRLNCYLPIIVCRAVPPSLFLSLYVSHSLFVNCDICKLLALSASVPSVRQCFVPGLAQQAELY